MNTFKKIQRAMIQNERDVLASIRTANKRGEGWTHFLMSMSWHNALDRLVQKGKVNFWHADYRSPNAVYADGYWMNTLKHHRPRNKGGYWVYRKNARGGYHSYHPTEN